MALNWPGLLAWSTKYHDGTKPSEFKVMSGEDRAFLEKAMEAAFGMIEDPNKVMQEARDQIISEGATDESIITSLEVIDRCCDDPDCARNAEKLDVIQPMLDLLASPNRSIQIRTLEILALLFSNNPNIQEAGMKRASMDRFIKLVKESPSGSEERSKSFRALVALVRNVSAYEEQLLEHDASDEVLVACLGRNELPGTREKALSFVRSLGETGTLKQEKVSVLAAAIAPLFDQLQDMGIQYRETLASCVEQLASKFKEECPSELASAVDSRLSGLVAKNDPEDAQETECLKNSQALLKA
eukprot:TRINITY_DN107405_c0_g1_i1.p1 TRINITY_DN107405_c0_g1~~TRINITY_DN107405_c0_g1_i1.p1  ORF type:complete len:317 (-),score=61.75 TRINITY_DN107405_c0_g1_i1:47-946(-)